MRDCAGPVIEISVFETEISMTGMKISPYEHSSTGDQDETFFLNKTQRGIGKRGGRIVGIRLYQH